MYPKDLLFLIFFSDMCIYISMSLLFLCSNCFKSQYHLCPKSLSVIYGIPVDFFRHSMNNIFKKVLCYFIFFRLIFPPHFYGFPITPPTHVVWLGVVFYRAMPFFADSIVLSKTAADICRSSSFTV